MDGRTKHLSQKIQDKYKKYENEILDQIVEGIDRGEDPVEAKLDVLIKWTALNRCQVDNFIEEMRRSFRVLTGGSEDDTEKAQGGETCDT